MRPTIDWWMDGGVYTFVCEAQDVFLTKQSFFYIKENLKHHQKTIQIKMYANRKVMIPQKFHQSLQPLKVVKAWLKWIKKCCSNISSIQPNTHKTPLDKKQKTKTTSQQISYIWPWPMGQPQNLWHPPTNIGLRRAIIQGCAQQALILRTCSAIHSKHQLISITINLHS